MRDARYNFNPCLFNECVYVFGLRSLLLEAFSPQTDTFLPHQLQLQLLDRTASCLFVHNNMLIVRTSQCISKFAAGRRGKLLQRGQVCTPTHVYQYSNSQPVVDTIRGVYFIIRAGEVLSLNLETGEEVDNFFA